MVEMLQFFFFQVNPEMVPELEKAGLSFVGKDESGKRMEVYILVKTVALIFTKGLRVSSILHRVIHLLDADH